MLQTGCYIEFKRPFPPFFNVGDVTVVTDVLTTCFCITGRHNEFHYHMEIPMFFYQAGDVVVLNEKDVDIQEITSML